MSMDKVNLLFFTRAMDIGGTEKVIIQLSKILKPYLNKVVVCSKGGVGVSELKKLGINHYILPDISNFNPFLCMRVQNMIRAIISQEKINVIHTHHRMAAFYVYLLRLYKKCIFINTAHNTFYDKKLLTKMAYKHARIIACGEIVKRNLTEFFGMPGDSITVIHNAVEEFDGKIRPIKLLQDLRNRRYCLVANIGRLSEQKGMEYFIQSLPIVKRSCEKVKYLIVGNGKDRSKLEKLAEELKVKDDVIFMGYCSDVQNLMSQVDFVVLSSLWEGLPLTPIEAFSVGKTVVATAVDGTVEIMNDRENGFLVEPRKPEQIAEKVIELIKNENKRAEFEKNAKETYLNEFSFEKYREKILNYYSNVQ